MMTLLVNTVPSSEAPSIDKTATTSRSKTDLDATTVDSEKLGTSPLSSGEDDMPEGGLRAWLTVAGGWMVVFCSFGAIQSFGVYQDYYTRFSLNEHSPSAISWIGSVQTFFLFVGGFPSGKLFDHGYFYALLVTGSLIYTISSFLLSLAKPHHFYQNFLAQGVGMGIGMGLLFLPSISVSSHYFKRRRGLAVGIMLTGTSFGAIVYPIILNRLFSSVGFGWGVRVVSFLNLGLLLGAILTMRTRLPPRIRPPGTMVTELKTLLTDVPYLIALAGISLTFWGVFVPFFYIQLFAVKHGINENLSTAIIPILNAVGFFGRTIPMHLSDLWGPFNVMIVCTVVSGGLAFAFLGATNSGGLIVFAVLYGFFSGGVVSVVSTVGTSFANDIGEVGARLGMMTTIVALFVLTGTPISGAILHPPSYLWLNAIIFSGTTILGGAALIILARALQAKRKETQWL